MGLRKLLLLLALLLSPLQALADDANLVFTQCGDEQQTQLRAAFYRVRQDLPGMLAKLQQGQLSDYVSVWFGTNAPADVQTRYEKITALVMGTTPIKFVCQVTGCTQNRQSFVENGAIEVCPAFFGGRIYNSYNSLSGTLLHEISHIAVDTKDHAYGMGDARILAHFEPAKAIENADNYQFMFEAATGYDLPYKLDAWSPANSCRWAFDGECDKPNSGNASCAQGTDTADCTNYPSPEK